MRVHTAAFPGRRARTDSQVRCAAHVGNLERGKFADIIAVSGNPQQDVKEMERVRVVMKGGVVMRDELTTAAPRRE